MVIGRVLIYTTLFALSVGHLILCFDESIWTILLCSTLGYTPQNMVYKIYLTIWVTILWLHGADNWGNSIEFELIFRLIYYGILFSDVKE